MCQQPIVVPANCSPDYSLDSQQLPICLQAQGSRAHYLDFHRTTPVLAWLKAICSTGDKHTDSVALAQYLSCSGSYNESCLLLHLEATVQGAQLTHCGWKQTSRAARCVQLACCVSHKVLRGICTASQPKDCSLTRLDTQQGLLPG